MDNAVARTEENALQLVKYSEQIGDPFEMSTIRREDFKFHKGETLPCFFASWHELITN